MVEHVTSHEFFEYFEAMFIMFSNVEYFVAWNKSYDYFYTRNIYIELTLPTFQRDDFACVVTLCTVQIARIVGRT